MANQHDLQQPNSTPTTSKLQLSALPGSPGQSQTSLRLVPGYPKAAKAPEQLRAGRSSSKERRVAQVLSGFLARLLCRASQPRSSSEASPELLVPGCPKAAEAPELLRAARSSSKGFLALLLSRASLSRSLKILISSSNTSPRPRVHTRRGFSHPM